AIAVSMSAGLARDLSALATRQTHREWQIAQELKRLGIDPGDAVALLGHEGIRRPLTTTGLISAKFASSRKSLRRASPHSGLPIPRTGFSCSRCSPKPAQRRSSPELPRPFPR